MTNNINSSTLKLYSSIKPVNTAIDSKFDKASLSNNVHDLALVQNRTLHSEIEKKEGDQKAYQSGFNFKKSIICYYPHKIVRNLLFHLQEKFFGPDTSLKKNSINDFLSALITYLSEWTYSHSNPAIGRLVQQLTLASRINMSPDFAKQAQQAILDSFKTKKSIFLFGILNNKNNSNVIAYEIIPISETSADFRIYHSRDNQFPYSEWLTIDKSALIDPLFLKALSELKGESHNPSARNEPYNDRDFLALKEILKPAKKSILEEIPTVEQNDKIPFFQSIFDIIKVVLKNEGPEGKALYRLLKCDLMLLSLCDTVFTSNVKNKFSHKKLYSKKTLYRFICHSLKNVADRISKLFSAKILGLNYVEDAAKALLTVQNWLRVNNRVMMTPAQENSATSERGFNMSLNLEHYNPKLVTQTIFDTIDCKYDFQNENEAESKFKKECLTAKAIPLEYFQKIAYQEGFSLEKIFSGLDSISLTASDAFFNGEDARLYSELIDWIAKLPVSKNDWLYLCKRNPFTIQSAIVKLGDLALTFFKTCLRISNASVIHPERLNTLNKILAIQTHLIDLITDDKQKFSYEKNYADSFYCINVEPEPNYMIGERPIKLNSNLNISLAKDPIRLQFNKGSSLSAISTIVLMYPELLDEEFRKEVASLTRNAEIDHVIDSTINLSTNLPDWLRSWRDANLALNWLTFVPQGISTLANLTDKVRFVLKKSNEDDETIFINASLIPREYNSFSLQSTNKNRLIDMHGTLSPSFRQILEHLSRDGWRKITERSLIEEFGGSEDILAILHIFAHSKFVEIEILEYFTKNPNKLKERDFQALFRMALFFNHEKSLFSSKTPKFLQLEYAEFFTKLRSFLLKQLLAHTQSMDIPPAVFFCQLHRLLRRFYPKHIADYSYLIRNLLEKKLKNEEKTIIYLELGAALLDIPSNMLTEDHIQDLIVANFFFNSRPIPAIVQDPITINDFKRSFAKHSHLVRYFLTNPRNEKAVQQVCDLSYIFLLENMPMDQWVLNNENPLDPVFVNKGHEYYPMRGIILSGTSSEATLPYEILNDANFKKLFPITTIAQQTTPFSYSFSLGSVLNPHLSMNQALMQSESLSGCRAKITIKNKSIVIEKEIKDAGWTRFIPKNRLIHNSDQSGMSLNFPYLIENYDHWQIEGTGLTKILFENPTSKQVEHVAELKFNNQTKKYDVIAIYHLGSQFFLVNPSELFSDFESSSYIHEWSDKLNGKAVFVDLPRFSLSFTRAQNGKLYCNQFSNSFYLVNPKPPIRQLSTFKHYIVLKNDEGDLKILLPENEFIASRKKEVFYPTFNIKNDPDISNNQICRYIIFEVSKHGNLLANTCQANLYMALVQTIIQNYDLSLWHLKKGNKIGPYVEAESAILVQLLNSQAISSINLADAAAMRAHAAYLLLKNAKTFQKKLSKNIYKAIIQAFDCYKKQSNSISSSLTLKKSEFDFLSMFVDDKRKKNISSNDKLIAIQNTSELIADGDRKIEKEEMFKEAEIEKFKKINFLNEIRESVFEEFFKGNLTKIDPNKASLTRFNLKGNLLGCFELLRSKEDFDRDWLRHMIPFLKSSTNRLNQCLALFFESLLDTLVLPSLPEKIYKFERLEYIQQRDWFFDLFESCKYHLENKIVRFLNNDKSLKSKIAKPKSLNSSPNSDKIIAQLPINLALEKPKDKVPAWLMLWPSIFTIDQSKSEADEKEGKLSLAENWVDEQIKKTDQLGAKSESSLEESNIGNLIHEAYKSLKNDFKQWNSKPRQVQVSFKPGIDLQSLNIDISKGQKEALRKLKEMESLIIHAANTFPQSNQSHESLARLSNSRSFVSLQDVIICFANSLKNPAAIRELNPHLTNSQINMLFSLTRDYLIESIYENQRTRALKSLKLIQELGKGNIVDNEAFKELVQELDLNLSIHPRTESSYAPFYLAFEYAAGINLRQDQFQALDTFIKNKNLKPIMEKIMGAGKSKILLPLLAHQLTTPGQFVVLMIPQNLYASTGNDTQKILQNTFGQTVKAIYFDRNTPLDSNTLGCILNDLKSAKEHCQPIIITNKTFLCLVLKYIELIDRYKTSNLEKWPEEITTMREILKFFSKANNDKSITIIDEIDSISNVLRKVCFSLGEPVAPESHETHILMHIMTLLFSDPLIKAAARCEADPSPNEDAPAMTKEIYREKVKPLLALAFIEKIPLLKFENPNYQNAIKELSLVIKESNLRGILVDYISQNEKKFEENFKGINSLSTHAYEIMRFAAQVIGHFLEHTTSRVNDQNYGIDYESSSSIAVPYLAASTPSKGSNFLNPHVTMIYTFQSYLKNGISKDLIKQCIMNLLSEAMREFLENDQAMSYQQTAAWKKFEEIKGPTTLSLSLNSEEINGIASYINSNIFLKCKFIHEIILPQMRLYKEQISCNPQNMISFLSFVMGFTGTLWNLMHRNLTLFPEAGIGAKTYEILFKQKGQIHTIVESSPAHMLKQLGNVKCDVFIDAGGYFRQGSDQGSSKKDVNLEIAREIATFYIKPVVFYNNEGLQMVTDGIKEMALEQSNFSEDNRIVFLDQAHTMGADIKYNANAIGIVSIGRNSIERDIRQAVWRLRKLGKNQKVVFVVSPDVATLIKQTINNNLGTVEKTDANISSKGTLQTSQNANKKNLEITFEEIIHFTIVNQCRQQGRDNILNFMQQLWDIPQQLAFYLGLDETIVPKQFYEVWETLRPLWISPGIKNAESYGKIPAKVKSNQFIQEYTGKCNELLKTINSKSPWTKRYIDFATTEIERLAKFISDKLPANIVTSPIIEDADSSLEIELEQEMEMEVTEDQLDRYGKLGYFYGANFKDVFLLNDDLFTYRHRSVPRFQLSLYFEKNNDFRNIAAAFSDVMASINIFAWPENDCSVKALKLFGRYRTPLHYVLVEDGEKLTILSKNDAEKYNLANNRILNLTLGEIGISKIQLSESLICKLVKIKFLNGETYYNKKEQPILKKWLKENNPAEMRQFFLESVLSFRPKALSSYPGSALSKIFKELISIDPIIADESNLLTDNEMGFRNFKLSEITKLLLNASAADFKLDGNFFKKLIENIKLLYPENLSIELSYLQNSLEVFLLKFGDPVSFTPEVLAYYIELFHAALQQGFLKKTTINSLCKIILNISKSQKLNNQPGNIFAIHLLLFSLSRVPNDERISIESAQWHIHNLSFAAASSLLKNLKLKDAPIAANCLNVALEGHLQLDKNKLSATCLFFIKQALKANSAFLLRAAAEISITILENSLPIPFSDFNTISNLSTALKNINKANMDEGLAVEFYNNISEQLDNAIAKFYKNKPVLPDNFEVSPANSFDIATSVLSDFNTTDHAFDDKNFPGFTTLSNMKFF